MAIPGLVDHIGAGVEERRVHVMVIQERPMQPLRQLHQPDRDAQRVPAARTPEALHYGIVAFGLGDGIREYE